MKTADPTETGLQAAAGRVVWEVARGVVEMVAGSSEVAVIPAASTAVGRWAAACSAGKAGIRTLTTRLHKARRKDSGWTTPR